MANKQTEVSKKVNVGLLGLGTVGGGVYKTIISNQETIRMRTGHEVEVSRILVRDLEKERQFDVDSRLLTLRAEDILQDESITVLLEVMGGIEPARTIITAGLQSGRHVITANKELMAKHGAELLAIAEEHGVHLLFEASVAGGIPVIRMLQGYLTANRVSEISGILNGTCNYILTEMAKTGREYADILADAIELGYAESDPTSDVEGFDAAYKLAILTNLAYEAHVPVEAIERQGISHLHAADLRCADRFGCAIKLIGAARQAQDGVTLSVRPRLLPKEHPLARIDDVFNAVTIQANVVGELTFSGRGAGEFPTASAVLEDLTVLLTGSNAIRRPTWKHPLSVTAPAPAPNGGLYVSFNCPSNTLQADAVMIAEAYAAAVHRSGGRIVQHALEESAGGILRQAWLIAGVGEDAVQKTLDTLAASDAHALSAVILPVDGLSTLGVEWEADQGWYEENASTVQAQAL